MKTTRWMFGMMCCFLMMAWVAVAADEELRMPFFEATVKGIGAFVVETDDPEKSFTFSVGLGRNNGLQEDEHKAIKYATRVKMTKRGQADQLPPKTPYPRSVASISCKQAGISCTYYLLPYFNMSKGMYSHEEVEASMPYWQTIYKPIEEREIAFRFVPEADGTLVYLEGSLLGRLEGVRHVTAVKPVVSKRAKEQQPLVIVSAYESMMRDHGMLELQPLKFRCNKLLENGAELSVGVGETVIAGIPMTVWDPAMSVDQGRHRKTTNLRDLVWDPLMERTPWSVGPEYMLWSIPGKTWRYAYILCADLADESKEPIVGTQFLKLGRGCTSGNINLEKTDLRDTAFAKRVKAVGELTYQKDGKTVKTPLYLVRQPLDITKLGNRGNAQFSLDFEFVGGGTWEGFKRSSVQIFGCTLQQAPYTMTVNNPVRGNLFEEDMPERKSVFELQATDDQVTGKVVYEVFDPMFKTLKKAEEAFAIAKRGDKQNLTVDFSEFPRGWYGVNYDFYDGKGVKVCSHLASFTVLAKDDREAGYDSPYAAWPLTKGKHFSNPNPIEQLEEMRKAGYRKTWNPPLPTEAECAPWKVTRSTVESGMKPGAPTKTRAEFDALLDKAVEEDRKLFEAFPHCQVIQLLHENGGREICPEVLGDQPAVRGEYKGWDFDTPDLTNEQRGNWIVFFCTEYAKRMRKEFPGKRIMIGNGSSSCERIASLVRDGLDLSLVTELGIESKGFSTMPEFNSNREAPGMLWALRETGRVFGYDHLKLNACNEYVFRPERIVSRDWTPWRIMRVANYSVRDYLVSLGHGCDIISHGHLEDCNDAYYDTNWGAGGQCTFYPNSYPKRMFTGIAVLTRALDAPVYQRRVPTGEITAHALEFLRNRRVKDYAYALWTPHYTVTLEMTFPKDTAVRKIEFFGTETELALDGQGRIEVDMCGTPCYVIASKAVESAKVIRHAAPEIPDGTKAIAQITSENVTVSQNPNGHFSNGWLTPGPLLGQFDFKDVVDEETNGPALEVILKKEGAVADVRWEYTQLDLKEPIHLKADDVESFGLMVKGNSAYQQVKLLVSAKGADGKEINGAIWLGDERSYVAFEGWQYMKSNFSENKMKGFLACGEFDITGIICGSARKALDPIEMADVTTNLRLGAVLVTPKAAATEEALQAPDAMGTVDDADW